jgi:tetratricopeptide (TPR) repeat protein
VEITIVVDNLVPKAATATILVIGFVASLCKVAPGAIGSPVDANVTSPANTPTAKHRLRLTIADCFLQLAGKQTIHSQKQIDDLVAKNPTSVQAHILRGHSLLLDGDTDGAQAEFDQALKLDPHSVAAYVGRSRVWTAKVRYAKAIAELEQAKKYAAPGEQKVRVFWEAAFINRESKKYPAAIENFNELLKMKFPSDQMLAFATLMRGETYARMGNDKEALKDFDVSIKLDPGAISAYTSRGEALERANRLKEALADYSQGIKNGMSDTPLYNAIGMTANVAGAYKDRARIENRLGQKDLAAEDLKKVQAQQSEYMEFAPFANKR